MESFVLLPSVLLGPTSMGPLAECLRERGRTALTADTAGAETPEQVALRYAAVAPDEPTAWVAHSNAGPYLPRILRDRPADVGVFLDASLPPDTGAAVSAPDALLPVLEDLAAGTTRVPPWTEWWTSEQLAELVPESSERERLRAGCPTLPLRYFTAEIDVPADWPQRAASYLSFDGAYVDERERASARGWRTRHVSGHHLSVFTEPARVADVLVELVDAVTGH